METNPTWAIAATCGDFPAHSDSAICQQDNPILLAGKTVDWVKSPAHLTVAYGETAAVLSKMTACQQDQKHPRRAIP